VVSDNYGSSPTVTLLVERANWLSEAVLLVVKVGNSESTWREQYQSTFLWLDLVNFGSVIFCLLANEYRQWQQRFID